MGIDARYTIMPNITNDKCETLVVDDSPTILATVKKMLGSEFIVHTARDGAEGWDVIKNNGDIKIVFSDMQMPVMNGMQLLLKIRESDDARISKLPVIMVTGQSDTPAGKKAVFDIGATDFIGKPFDAMDLLSRARTNTQPQRRATDKSGNEKNETVITPSVFQSIGKTAIVKAFETKEEFTVVNIEFINIDLIKNIVGNKSVRQIILSLVKRINDLLRDDDVATRIGENKFAVLLYSDGHNANQTVERLCEYMKKLAFEHDGSVLRVELAYGHSTVNCYDSAEEFSGVCSQADVALAAAKQITLGNRITAYTEGDIETSGAHNDNDKTDLWAELTHIVDGNYHLIKSEQMDDLVRCMNDFLTYAKENK